MIKLIEGTDYRYDGTLRFYGWEYAEELRPIRDCGAKNAAELYLACLKAWSIDTCSARFRDKWSPDDPSVGQCTITAAIVHELFGGEIYGLPLLVGGGMHSYNVIGGRILDLACEQFGKDALPDFSCAVPVDPEKLLEGGDKAERCALLKQRLAEVLEG